MLRLKNVSKFYYSKGIVASGFSKVDLELEIGEFVAITGESGSGKSTLINVISGLDTYEEGEMYINGEETSHYTEKDFEEYRRNYIGNIFQNFNLISSYTVFQNIELVLLLNGYSKKTIKEKVNKLIEEVGLEKYTKTKVSKLSGGQKQRVAIARALAKETKIIVADEPTGNLDSKSAEGIVELLHKISKDKLVIVVTHNFEQIEKHVTRKIKMYDGKVIEDKKVKPHQKPKEVNSRENETIKTFPKIQLGIRNTFNIIPKFVLLLIVYSFITLSLSSLYFSNLKSKDEEIKSGFNNFFRNTSDERIIIKKEDKTTLLEEDYKKISAIDNINYIVKDDFLLDLSVVLNSDSFYTDGLLKSLSKFEGKLTEGRMPQNEFEVIAVVSDKSWNQIDSSVLDINELNLEFNGSKGISQLGKVKIVGIKRTTEKNYDVELYANESWFKKIREALYKSMSEEKMEFHKKTLINQADTALYKIVPNKNVKSGQVYISSDLNIVCPKSRCLKTSMFLKSENKLFSSSIELKVAKVYTKYNFTKTTGEKDYVNKNGEIYVNEMDYNNLYNKGEFQASVFVKDYKKLDQTSIELDKLGLTTFELHKSKVGGGEISLFLNIFNGIVNIVLVISIMFISYFVIKLILKSRNIYFTTIRILGASKKVATQILHIELWTIVNISYLIFVYLIYLVGEKVITNNYLYSLSKYLQTRDYFIIYGLLLTFSFVISNRFARKIFVKSAMNTYREEV